MIYSNGSIGAAGMASGLLSGLTVKANDTSPQPKTEVIQDSLSGAINRVHNAIERVRGFADAMLGSRPMASSPKGEVGKPSGRLHDITDRTAQLHDSLATLEGELDRLGAI